MSLYGKAGGSVQGLGQAGHLYGEVQCIMGNGQMGSPVGETDGQIGLISLPSTVSLTGGKDHTTQQIFSK